MNSQNRFHSRLSTPWGAIQTYDKLADGVYTVDTAGHGGLWLSDERIAQLPEHYESFACDNRRWHEEDEDAPLVLQYLGLLSLIDEPLTLEVTEVDIEAGRKSRKGLYNSKWHFAPKDKYDQAYYGGAIVEAYQRQTGDTYFQMICSHHLAPVPGGFKLADIGDTGRDWQACFDRDEQVEPITLTLEPYRVLERVDYVHHLVDGGTRTDRVSGHLANHIAEGDARTLEMYRSIWIKDDVLKVTHEDRVIWHRQ